MYLAVVVALFYNPAEAKI